jgi:ATP-dependent Clp protease ATP-binding subunit ClpA
VFERFTDRARHVLVLAQDEARELQHNFIGTEHILLGLVAERDGVAARVLASFGLSLAEIQDTVSKAVGPIPGAGAGAAVHKPPFTPRAKQVLEYALREALQLGHNYIGTEHLLLGVIREGEGVGAKVLAGSGVELTEVRDRVLDTLSRYNLRQTPSLPRRLSTATNSALSQASALAKERALTTGQLLLGILAVEGSHAARALTALGVSRSAVEAKLEEIPVDSTSDAGPRPQTVEIKVGNTSTVITDPELAAGLQQAGPDEVQLALRQVIEKHQRESPPDLRPGDPTLPD